MYSEESFSPRKSHTVVLIGFLLILGVIMWFIGQNWHENRQSDVGKQATPSAHEDIAMTDLKFLSPKEVLARISRNEKMILIDIRPRTEYDVEHIVDSISVPTPTLGTFTPEAGQLIIVISGPDIPNDALKAIHQLFTQQNFSFAFLQGSTTDWRFSGGNTISSGDPESSLDYSKVIFINGEEVLPLAETLISHLFLDIRSPSEYAKSRLPGAINIQLDELEQRRSDIPRQKSLFVYGINDFESYQGGVRLFDLGFFGARVIRGGFGMWQEKKLPIETGPPTTPLTPKTQATP